MKKLTLSLSLLLTILHAAVAQQPVITSLSMLAANPGAAVTVNGTGFNATAANNIVYFGATRATVTAATATALTVSVPAGATYNNVSVNNTASALTGYSQYPFLPTYDNSGFVPNTVNFGSGVDFAASSGPEGVAIADIDGDGKSELIVANKTAGNVAVYRNTSTAGSISVSSFAAPVAVTTGSNPFCVAVGDVDGDGKKDIVVTNQGSSTVSVFRNIATSGAITLGSFGARVDFVTGLTPFNVVLADLDGDGKPEMVVTNKDAATISVLRNTATAGVINSSSFAAKVDYAAPADVWGLAVGDVDGDAKVDVVVTGSTGNTVAVYRNTSSTGVIDASTLAGFVGYTTATLPTSVAVSDVDGDGKSDLLVANNTSNSVSVLRNTSTTGVIDASSFAAKVDFATGTAPRTIAVGDVNGDGKPDMVTANLSGNNASVLRNVSTSGSIVAGSFATAVNYGTANQPNGLAIGDVDNDGKPEIVTANVSGSLTVLRNNPIQPNTGVAAVCVGGNTTLNNATGGGTWSSANTFFATINTSGLVTGVSVGTVTLSYSLPGGVATTVVTVSAAPAAGTITGTGVVCVGSNITLTNATTGGVWSSSNTAVGTIGTSGIVTGIAAGTTTISYAVTNACATAVTSRIVTVNALPDAIAGTLSICVSGISTLTTATTGVTWSTADPSIATVGSLTGDVSGVSAGIVAIDCHITATGCSRSVNVTVNPFPASISGASSVCVGATTAFTNATSGGSWSSTNPLVADIDASSGVVTGLTSGTSIILYSLPTGCGTSRSVTVNAAPAAIGGVLTSCIGVATTLTNDTTGGAWTSSDVTVATVGTGSGVVTGVATGTVTISYAISTGCHRAVIYTVNAVPAAIGGTLVVCQGTSTTLTNSVLGGTWNSSTGAIATIGSATGMVTAVSAGTTAVSYTTTPGCFATSVVTVNTLATPVTGVLVLCAGDTATLANATSSGTWSSSSTAVATVNAITGFMTGVGAGTATISYTVATGCFTTSVVTINPLPMAGTLSGTPSVCVGNIRTLSSSATGGVWSSSNTTVATVGTSGIVVGVAAGTSIISYTVTNVCGVAATSVIVTVTALPDTGVISGFTSVCAGSSITLSHSLGGGSWSSTNTLAATITSTGIVTAIDPGTTTISYTRTNVCGSVAATSIVTVNPLPALITGTTSVCAGSSTTLASATAGGTWSSAHATATVGTGTGVVTGVAAGTARISYTLSIGCFRTTTVTVSTIPAPILGVPNVCVGSTRLYTNATPGGVWVSSNTAVAPLSVPTSGTVIGASAGTASISYIISNGCSRVVEVTVNPTPSTISGTLVLCSGDTATLSSNISGGTWVITLTGRATVGYTTGLLTGISGGTSRITYTTAGGCSLTAVVTVNATPMAIVGSNSVCEGSTTPLSSPTSGGTWSSAHPTIAGVVLGTGVTAGLSAGTALISYRLATGCFRTKVVTVNPLPDSIIGATTVCTGNTTILMGYPSGGAWTSSNTARATVSGLVAGGAVTGVSAGGVVISYSRGTCRRPYSMTVNSTPANITGTPSVCVGTTTTLSNATSGGTWLSANTALATVGSVAGVVTGVSSGTVSISYVMLVTGCRSTVNVTVHNNPSSISGSTLICQGTTSTLGSTPFGGTWTSSNLAIATVNPSTGLVSGLTAGTARITYRLGTGCINTIVVTINPLASAGSLSGPSGVCPAAVFSLTPSVAGGTWSTSTGNVSVTTGGLVTGITAGVDTVKYTVTTGCGSNVARHPVTVYSRPDSGVITGNTNVCLGQDGLLGNDVAGGVWSSANTGVATVSASGVLAGVSLGTALISYTVSNLCGSATTTTTVTVIPLTIDAGNIIGKDSVCDGDTILLNATVAGGVWSSSNTLIAGITTAGVVTGVTPGTATIKYIVVGQCAADTAQLVVTVKSVFDCFTSVDPVKDLEKSVTIYPNPTTGSFVVSTQVPGTLSVWSIDGKLVFNKAIADKETSIVLPAGITSGIYVSRFTDIEGNSTVVRLNYQP